MVGAHPSFSVIVILSPLKNVDRDHIGSRTGNSFERKFSLLMHVDACKAQEIVENKIPVIFFAG